MKSALHHAWVEVDLNALEFNVRGIQKKLPKNVTYMAVVKANSYGHGNENICEKLWNMGIRWFAVANLDEAISVRKYCPEAEIFILGYTPPYLAPTLAENNIIQGIVSMEYAKELSESATSPVRGHIKLDTGMGRIGTRCTDTETCGKELLPMFELPNLKLEGVYTHFAAADSPEIADVAYTRRQEDRIVNVYNWLAENGHKLEHIHFMNSAASVYCPSPRCTLSRVGILMYGLLPHAPYPVPITIKPAMRLKSTVVQIEYIEKTKQTIAVVPVGYSDGYSRLLANKAQALIHDVPCTVVGEVHMNYLTLDITEIAESVNKGDEVILFGKGAITANYLAFLYDTIGDEVICNVSRRIPRIIVNEEIKDEDLILEKAGVSEYETNITSCMG